MADRFFTMGYTGTKIADLQAFIEEHDATLVDIRFSPQSANPTWRKAEVRRALPPFKYVCLPEWGNRNYRNGGPIDIVDIHGGWCIVNNAIDGRQHFLGSAMVLMCACAEYEGCHRAVIADYIRAYGGHCEEIDLRPKGATVKGGR